jgi:hypothetical protein
LKQDQKQVGELGMVGSARRDDSGMNTVGGDVGWKGDGQKKVSGVSMYSREEERNTRDLIGRERESDLMGGEGE